ncbi:KOW domain-containing RNA-binding protein [uncultured Eubacterium sp.]|uniref:KOW domain-containing RNA-binding protein n=1 Tax=uncultured Eubacterium sp. TaxID=165185 RepID=UPI0025D2E206|nr:KOW domain-containing RNA-binding protein [uncultured Eubacterium sp.]
MHVELALSMAGHDKGHYYVITGEEGNFVYVADGTLKLCAQPKRKNRRHIQLIRRLPAEVEEIFQKEESWSDLTVKRALKLYKQYLNEAE